MTQKQLQQLLQEPYSTNNWKQLIKHVFENVQLLATPKEIPINDERVRSFKQYGSVQLHDGKILALFELTLHDNVNLIRNRVGLNDIVSRYIDQETTHGVLSIFEQGKEDYRFTFSAHATEFDEEDGDFVDIKTDTKRFTYILGKNESCRTAAQRFDELSVNKQTADMTSVEKAFSVEKLSKLFFKEYTDQFNNLVNYIKSEPGYYQAIFEKEESSARNFVKIFLGRLVFIKFVEKKGWLGVPADKKGWKNGDYKFLKNSYDSYTNKDIFLSEFLNPLFFDALNTGSRENDVFKLTGSKIPHLSGGLFENEDSKTLRIDFPESHLNDLFNFFDRYNFTIDENDVHDKEVGIDPEMLGHIFENLLEDNKDKGAFYTPKEIVRYMCQESLKEYLFTYLENLNIWPKENDKIEEAKELLKRFVEKKEVARILKWDKPLAKALKQVKICDPAIGSGAFPMGLLNEIFILVKILHDESPDSVGAIWGMQGDEWQANRVKLNIIQNSIYGVDIEPGAVNIARLRFWLSLIIEEDIPQPLPHLDYKIVVGNSLVSKLDDTIINIDWDLKPENSQTNMFGNPHAEKLKKLLNEITELQKEVFRPESDDHFLSVKIRNKKIELLISQLELMIETRGLKEKPKGNGRSIKKRMELWLQSEGWKQQIKKLDNLKKDDEKELHFFDWKLDFPEIMNEDLTEEIGFDIVIGNPPYVSIKNQSPSTRKLLKNEYEYSSGADIYVAFIELATKLKKRNQVISYIVPNKFFGANYGIKIRKYIKDNLQILAIWDLKDIKVFENAQISTIVLIFSDIKEVRPVMVRKDSNEFPLTDVFDSSGKIQIESNEVEKVLLKRIYEDYDKLSSCADIRTGIVGFEYWKMKDIIFNNTNESEDYRRLYTNGNCKRYEDNWTEDIKLYKETYSQPVIRLDENYLSSNTIKLFKTSPKIIVRGVSKCVSAFRDNSGSAMLVAVHSAIPINIEFELLLGILNSKFINWLHLKIFYSIRIPQGSLKYPINFFESLPAPAKKFSESYSRLVIRLEKSHQNGDSDMKELEDELDLATYKLYGLSFSEVLIVDPELENCLTEERYNKLEIV